MQSHRTEESFAALGNTIRSPTMAEMTTSASPLIATQLNGPELRTTNFFPLLRGSCSFRGFTHSRRRRRARLPRGPRPGDFAVFVPPECGHRWRLDVKLTSHIVARRHEVCQLATSSNPQLRGPQPSRRQRVIERIVTRRASNGSITFPIWHFVASTFHDRRIRPAV